MRNLAIFLFFMFAVTVISAAAFGYRQLVIYDKATGRIVKFFPQGGFHSPDYKNRDDVIFDPDMTALENKVKQRYWKVEAGKALEMNASEKTIRDMEDVVVSSQ